MSARDRAPRHLAQFNIARVRYPLDYDAAWPVQGLLRHFRREIDGRVDDYTLNAGAHDARDHIPAAAE